MRSRCIETRRLILRPVRLADATTEYLSWLRQRDSRKYVASARTTGGLAELRGYIARRLKRRDVLFLAMIDKTSGRHIGNIKYEPINVAEKHAVMGILIGDPRWRGKGVAAEAIHGSAALLRDRFGTARVYLGVHKDNPAGLHAYRKAGFRVTARAPFPHDPGVVDVMVLRLSPRSTVTPRKRVAKSRARGS